MDSDSYLLKIIKSGTKHTQDSLFLQTTIGQGMRWPIVLLISTAVGAVAIVVCLVWVMVRRPVTSVYKTRDLVDDDDDIPQVIITSSPSSPATKKGNWPHNPSDFEAHFFQDTLWPSHIHEVRSELNLNFSEKSPLLSPKRMVSWASTESIKSIPRTKRSHRRHSDATPGQLEKQLKAPSYQKKISRRYSDLDVSAVATATIMKSRTSSPIKVRYSKHNSKIPVMNPNKKSELHLQIAKTIAALDDLNKSLQGGNKLKNFTSGIIAQQSSDLAAANRNIEHSYLTSSLEAYEKPKKAKFKLCKTPKKLHSLSFENKWCKNPASESKGVQDANDINELEKLLDAQFDTFQGQ